MRSVNNTTHRSDEVKQDNTSHATFTDFWGAINEYGGGQFLKFNMRICQRLDGDTGAAVVLAYILNLLNMKQGSHSERTQLEKNELWFRCPAGDIQKDLGITHHKQRRVIDTLAKDGVISTERRMGNYLWIRVNTDRLHELGKPDTDAFTVSDIRKPYNRFTETVNPLYSKNSSKNCRSQARDGVTEVLSHLNGHSHTSNGNGKQPHQSKLGFTSDHKKAPAHQLAKRLHTILSETRKLTRPVKDNLRSWTVEFANLLQVRTEEQIREGLEAFRLCLIDKYQYTPRLYSAKSFCAGFSRIEDMMERGDRTPGKRVCRIVRKTVSVTKEVIVNGSKRQRSTSEEQDVKEWGCWHGGKWYSEEDYDLSSFLDN